MTRSNRGWTTYTPEISTGRDGQIIRVYQPLGDKVVKCTIVDRQRDDFYYGRGETKQAAWRAAEKLWKA